VTVQELIKELEKMNGTWPVLAYWPETGGYIEATAEIVNENRPRPYVVIKAIEAGQ
jgi:hypothetical protein